MNNLLTNYFKKAERNTDKELTTESSMVIEEEEIDEDEGELFLKRLKIDQNSKSSTTTCSILSSERDPCNGLAAAKQFVFIGPYQPDLKFPTINSYQFCRQWHSIYPWLQYTETKDRAFYFICHLSFGTDKTEEYFALTGFNDWKNGSDGFNRYQSSIPHKEALAAWKTMKKNL